MNRDIEQSLIQFVNYCERNDYHIHILGDLFDYWMEYPGRIPDLGRDLLQRFRQYNRRNEPVLYITGNHDNWTRGHFGENGFDVEPEYRTIAVGGDNVLLLHGDGVNDPELELPRKGFHRFLRNRSFIRWYQRILPPAAGLKLMKYFSKMTRKFGEETENKEDLNKWAESALKKMEIDVILCGHDHEPRILDFDFGTFINLGTFYKHRTVVIYNNGEFRLVVWDDNSEALIPFDPQS